MNLIKADIFEPSRAVNRLHRDADRFFLPLRFRGAPAQYRDGVLELAIAKRRQAEPRRIEISTA